MARFISKKPFPLRLKQCQAQAEPSKYITDILQDFGGLRFSTRIGEQAGANLTFLENGGWDKTRELLEKVGLNPSAVNERTAARFLDDHLKGFGPKQSRNLLQGLGLSQYEIPIDSRITKWLNKFGFPVRLTANALNDQNYYEFISDGFQQLAKASGIVPCVLDAAIFAS